MNKELKMIPEIKTILYASDLSEGSKPAYMLAAKEAFKHEAQIVFLNVIEPISHATEALLENYMADAELRAMRGQGIEKIRGLMEQRIDEFNQTCLQDRLPLQKRPLTRVESGPAAETIISVAEEVAADLIVMGTRSRTHSSLGRFLVGSTAQNVMQMTATPLLVVPLTEG
ncbi:universal stress protein [Neptuniibacter halophilus]|uniref:universal stress protein n=1 Tax=Neptuniibacter halophilus TaxID=651666 RepID=UPI0025741679|nr:universal stress protein [Neptuniibacter halophilus]